MKECEDMGPRSNGIHVKSVGFFFLGNCEAIEGLGPENYLSFKFLEDHSCFCVEYRLMGAGTEARRLVSRLLP